MALNEKSPLVVALDVRLIIVALELRDLLMQDVVRGEKSSVGIGKVIMHYHQLNANALKEVIPLVLVNSAVNLQSIVITLMETLAITNLATLKYFVDVAIWS